MSIRRFRWLFPVVLFWALLAAPAHAQYVFAWGDNSYGQRDVPAGLTGVTQISLAGHGLALRSNGTVVAWGWNAFGQADVPVGLDHVVQVATGWYHSLALKDNGTVVAWGYDYDGQCDVPAGLTDVVSIGAGDNFSLAVKKDGSVVAWGDRGGPPVQVWPWVKTATKVTGGGYHSLAILQDTTVAAWGQNTNGQLAVPAGLTDVIQIGAGSYWSAALKSDGTVVTWGAAPAIPDGLTDVIGIGAGPQHLVLLRSGGTIAENAPIGLKDVTQVAGGMNFASAAIVTVPFPLLLISPTPILGGNTATGSVKLVDLAPAGGTTVHLTSSNPCASVPATVIVPEGQQSVTFPITTTAITKDTDVAITCAIDGYNTATTPMTVLPLFAGISVSKPTLVGGAGLTDTVTVTLNGPAPRGGMYIPLSSDNAIVTPPATVKVGSGAMKGTAKVTAANVTVPTDVHLTATVADKSATATITVLPLLYSIGAKINPVYGGRTIAGVVRLNTRAPVGGVEVALSSGDPAVTVPASVIVPEGANNVSFSIVTHGVSVDRPVKLSASLRGVTVSMTLNVLGLLNGVLIWPDRLTGGQSMTGTVFLSAPAPSTTVVTLSSDDPAAEVPASVTFPAGARQRSFTIKTSPVAENHTATISATYGPATKSASLLILNTTIASLTMSPTSLLAGNQGTATVTLTAPAPSGGALVSLSSEDSSIASVPDSVLVPQGATSATFPVQAHTPPSSGYYISIFASFNTGSATFRFPIYLP